MCNAEQKSDLLVWIEVFQLDLRVCYFGHGGLLSFSLSFCHFLILSIFEKEFVASPDGTAQFYSLLEQLCGALFLLIVYRASSLH